MVYNTNAIGHSITCAQIYVQHTVGIVKPTSENLEQNHEFKPSLMSTISIEIKMSFSLQKNSY